MLELITVYSHCVGSAEQRMLLRRVFFSFCNWGRLKKNIFAVMNWPDALITAVKVLSCKMVQDRSQGFRKQRSHFSVTA